MSLECSKQPQSWNSCNAEASGGGAGWDPHAAAWEPQEVPARPIRWAMESPPGDHGRAGW